MTVDIAAILQAGFGLALSLLLYFIKGTMGRVEKSIEELRDTQLTIRLIQAQLSKIENDVKNASEYGIKISQIDNRLAIFERNLETAFKKIDECRSLEAKVREDQDKTNDLVRRRTHHIQNKLMIIKATLERSGTVSFQDDWSMM